MQFSSYNGTLSLIGDNIDNIGKKWTTEVPIECRDNNKVFHITIFTAKELKSLQNKLTFNYSEWQIPNVYDIGIGKQKEDVYYVVIESPDLNDLRQKYSLEPKDFHITLSLHDRHDCVKNHTTIYKKSPVNLDLLFEKSKRMKKNKEKIRDIYDFIKNEVLNEEIKGSSEKVLAILNHNKFMYYEKCARHYFVQDKEIKYIESPRNFSRINDTIYASAIISKSSELQFLETVGNLTKIISLLEPHESSRLCSSIASNPNFQHIIYSIKDQTPPSIEQMKSLCREFEDSTVLVHCMGGKGRTAVVLIAYLMWKNKMTRTEAEKMLTNRVTILSKSQVEFLKQWYIESKKPKQIHLPNRIILVGFPGSGKSTLSKHLEEFTNVVRLNQDEMGKKEMEKSLSDTKSCLIDRCNLTVSQRSEWLSAKDTWCIFMNIPKEQCLYQASNRTDHPTLKPGQGMIHIFDNLHLESPTKDEGFSKIITLNNYSEVNDFVSSLGIMPLSIQNNEKLYKFPRTKHLLNLGGATRDDLVLTVEQSRSFLNIPIQVEEKVDGANMGISIEKDTNKVLVQNRSHYINSKYHKQFEKLDNWISKHMDDLFTVLEPGRHILFGEWLYAKHSIHYTNLDDLFIVFDIFDKYHNKFYSRQKLHQTLQSTSLSIVPLLHNNHTFTSLTELKGLIQTNSRFYNGAIEGLYIRVDEGDWLKHRAKIVRNDFISGNEHWSKGILTKNEINRND